MTHAPATRDQSSQPRGDGLFSRLRNLSIKARLILLVTLLSLLIVIVGALGIVGMRSANQAMETIYHDRVVPLADMTRITDHLNAMRIHAINASNDNGVTGAINSTRQLDTEVDQVWADFMATYLTEEEAEIADRFQAALDDYRSSRDRTLQLAEAGDFEASTENATNHAGPRYSVAHDALVELVEVQTRIAEEVFADATARYELERNLTIAAIVVALIISLVMSSLLIRAVTGPLQRMVGYLQEIAKGNLTSDIRVDSSDEVGQALKALASTQEAQRSLVEGIKQAAESISTASGQIAAGNTDLSNRTEEQAASLQETAASMEEVSSTIRQNSDNTSQANRIAQQTRETAEGGGRKNRQAMEKMKELSECSDKITGIISVIDNIAFQTNILALNASVEAARAGEQGRGFAVVASEVRILAQRSAEAAREIQQLITLNSDIVSQSTGFVDDAGTAMEEIVTSVRRVSDLMSEIAQASTEQTQSIEHVSVAVNQMDQVTQQNAALVEESAAAAASLEDQARHLAEAVSVFRTTQVSSLSESRSSGRSRSTHAASAPDNIRQLNYARSA